MKTKTAPSIEPAPTPEATEPMLPYKLGANHNETAPHPRKHDNNFKQSKDLREDRGIRQMKTAVKRYR